jgi:hypothetical protein
MMPSPRMRAVAAHDLHTLRRQPQIPAALLLVAAGLTGSALSTPADWAANAQLLGEWSGWAGLLGPPAHAALAMFGAVVGAIGIVARRRDYRWEALRLMPGPAGPLVAAITLTRTVVAALLAGTITAAVGAFAAVPWGELGGPLDAVLHLAVGGAAGALPAAVFASGAAALAWVLPTRIAVAVPVVGAGAVWLGLAWVYPYLPGFDDAWLFQLQETLNPMWSSRLLATGLVPAPALVGTIGLVALHVVLATALEPCARRVFHTTRGRVIRIRFGAVAARLGFAAVVATAAGFGLAQVGGGGVTVGVGATPAATERGYALADAGPFVAQTDPVSDPGGPRLAAHLRQSAARQEGATWRPAARGSDWEGVIFAESRLDGTGQPRIDAIDFGGRRPITPADVAAVQRAAAQTIPAAGAQTAPGAPIIRFSGAGAGIVRLPAEPRRQLALLDRAAALRSAGRADRGPNFGRARLIMPAQADPAVAALGITAITAGMQVSALLPPDIGANRLDDTVIAVALPTGDALLDRLLAARAAGANLLVFTPALEPMDAPRDADRHPYGGLGVLIAGAPVTIEPLPTATGTIEARDESAGGQPVTLRLATVRPDPAASSATTLISAGTADSTAVPIAVDIAPAAPGHGRTVVVAIIADPSGPAADTIPAQILDHAAGRRAVDRGALTPAPPRDGPAAADRVAFLLIATYSLGIAGLLTFGFAVWRTRRSR